MDVLFVDQAGITGVIQNDLTIKAEVPVSTDVRLFINGVKRTHEETPLTAARLGSQFLIELYVQTSVRKVERVVTTREKARWQTTGQQLVW